MEWSENGGRTFRTISRFQGLEVQPWKFGKENNVDSKKMFHLGHSTPIGYWGGSRRDFDQPTGLYIRRSLGTNKKILKTQGLALGVFYPDKNEPISEWNYFRDEYEESEYLHKKTCKYIIERGKKFGNLTHFIFGNYFMDDYYHTFYNVDFFYEILENFPKLEHLLVRGGFGHSPIQSRKTEVYPKLKTLTIQTFGLSNAYLNQIITSCDFPNLLSLDLHLGTEFYNGMDKIYGLTNLLAGKFPSLSHLGLLDSDVTDDIAYELAHSTVIEQLSSLDLSFGTLTDEGAEVLLNSPKTKSLKHLNVHSNHLSQEYINEIFGRNMRVSFNPGEQKGELNQRFWMIRE